jgi:hypothetical protein
MNDPKLFFLEKTGYSDKDLLAWNPETLKFSMKNGGLYQLSGDGQIKHLGGPSPDPAERI